MIRPAPHDSVGIAEMQLVEMLIRSGRPLSGYLAGRKRGGYYVQMLEEEWCDTFNVKHAIACNSATSGLLAAAFAASLKQGDKFAVSALTMSATAAAPMFTGATPVFCDVSVDDFALNATPTGTEIKAVFMTSLFGHPGPLDAFRKHADRDGTILIEDASQSPLAMENGRYVGTVGHIGVFSLNVHKPLQCGEGGVVTTDDDELAMRLRNFINHGENAGDQIGLNLRMPELCAAVAVVQLRRAHSIIRKRVEQAEAILDAIGPIPGLRPPIVGDDCVHVYYTIPFLIDHSWRWNFCSALEKEGVPIVHGYVPPLYRLPAFKTFAQSCPIAEDLHDRSLFYIENCAWDFNAVQIRQIGDTFKRVAEKIL